jgi:hypothetical protein
VYLVGLYIYIYVKEKLIAL